MAVPISAPTFFRVGRGGWASRAFARTHSGDGAERCRGETRRERGGARPRGEKRDSVFILPGRVGGLLAVQKQHRAGSAIKASVPASAGVILLRARAFCRAHLSHPTPISRASLFLRTVMARVSCNRYTYLFQAFDRVSRELDVPENVEVKRYAVRKDSFLTRHLIAADIFDLETKEKLQGGTRGAVVLKQFRDVT